MAKRSFIAFFGCGLLALGSVQAQAAVIDFEDLGVAPGTQFEPPDGATTTSGGFDFIHGPLSTINDLHFPRAPHGNAVGSSTELLAHENVIMTRNGGGTFSLSSFLWGSSFVESLSFSVEGTLFGGGTISQTFFPDQDESSLESFVFNAGFVNLVSAKWTHISGSQGLQNIDDIAVDETAAVPEPTTLTLLGFGLAGLAARRRKSAV